MVALLRPRASIQSASRAADARSGVDMLSIVTYFVTIDNLATLFWYDFEKVARAGVRTGPTVAGVSCWSEYRSGSWAMRLAGAFLPMRHGLDERRDQCAPERIYL